jgi:hypothetical protein
VLCSPWATLADLPDNRPAAVTDAQWDTYLLAASQILFDLSGRKWHGGGCTATETFDEVCAAACRCGVLWLSGWTRCSGCNYTRPCRVRLRSTTNVEVTSVELDEVLVPVDGYHVQDGWLIDDTRVGWVLTGGRTVVAYTWGAAPPTAGRLAAATLALELGKAGCRDSSCRLPQRLQTLTRQGVTATFLDPQTFLSDRRTGLTEVDLWLAAVNPNRSRQPARVWSPETAARGRTPAP